MAGAATGINKFKVNAITGPDKHACTVNKPSFITHPVPQHDSRINNAL